jgi:hypothetical protein
MKSERGALRPSFVIKIVVLMLIAGVALYVVLQDNGAVDRALEESSQTENQYEENVAN